MKYNYLISSLLVLELCIFRSPPVVAHTGLIAGGAADEVVLMMVVEVKKNKAMIEYNLLAKKTEAVILRKDLLFMHSYYAKNE